MSTQLPTLISVSTGKYCRKFKDFRKFQSWFKDFQNPFYDFQGPQANLIIFKDLFVKIQRFSRLSRPRGNTVNYSVWDYRLWSWLVYNYVRSNITLVQSVYNSLIIKRWLIVRWYLHSLSPCTHSIPFTTPTYPAPRPPMFTYILNARPLNYVLRHPWLKW